MSALAKINAESNFTTFKFGFHEIRVINKDNELWFVAHDICSALEIRNISQAIGRLDDDERSVFNIGRQGDINIVSESGMYTLVLRCRDAIKQGSVPHQFRKWVTGEVLPAIRNKGSDHSSMISDLSFNGRILMIFENGTVASQKILHSDEEVLTLDTFMELAQRAGYLVIHREKFLSLPNQW
ncbi:prophage antirepressor [Photorhabdus aegyptia]|uniref:Prophage antirepressor n=1 Tax=Photorhabdus aegyptia TaxID=2805098 RepID=A0A022PKM0_9GAMM|nr:prophage antirepressor [Photorhabdus aegyptia]